MAAGTLKIQTKRGGGGWRIERLFDPSLVTFAESAAESLHGTYGVPVRLVGAYGEILREW